MIKQLDVNRNVLTHKDTLLKLEQLEKQVV